MLGRWHSLTIALRIIFTEGRFLLGGWYEVFDSHHPLAHLVQSEIGVDHRGSSNLAQLHKRKAGQMRAYLAYVVDHKGDVESIRPFIISFLQLWNHMKQHCKIWPQGKRYIANPKSDSVYSQICCTLKTGQFTIGLSYQLFGNMLQ